MSGKTPSTPIGNWLAQCASTAPDRIALLEGTREITYAELESLAREASYRLAAEGVAEGSVAVLELPAGIEFAVLTHALAKLGAIALPLNPRLSAAEREAAIDRARPAIVVAETKTLGAHRPEVQPVPLLSVNQPDAVLAQILTSGTSGAGKTIGLTYGNFLASAVGSARAIAVEPGDRWLCCMPLFHVGGLSILTRAAIYGTGVVIHDVFDVDRVARSLAEDRVTGVSLVATQLRRLLEAGVDLSAPRSLVIGGGPVPSELLGEAIRRGASVVQTYGLTEACSQVTILRPDEALEHLGSSGRPLPGTEVRIEAGEVLVRGATVAPGSPAGDGWLHTGDLGHVDEHGHLYVTGRRGDLIVSGGENILPDEIEEALSSHPAVADVAVIGRPDPEWQEAVTAVVVLRDGSSAGADELRAHLAPALASFKVPKRFEFVAELPRTASGKLQRGKLR